MKVAAAFIGDKAYHELLDAGNEFADQNAAAELLERTREPLLCELKLKSAEKSDAARETIAMASVEYRVHVEQMIEARRLANRAKARLGALQTLVELRRTEESTRRQELRFIQGGGAN